MSSQYKKIHWTEHAKLKMRQYGLSKNKLLVMLYKFQRKEAGIVPGTTAVMQVNKSYSSMRAGSSVKSANLHKKASGEVWLMYRDAKGLRKIISAWRYPGVSKPGEVVDIIAKYSD